jgi:hypothetical protein
MGLMQGCAEVASSCVVNLMPTAPVEGLSTPPRLIRTSHFHDTTVLIYNDALLYVVGRERVKAETP